VWNTLNKLLGTEEEAADDTDREDRYRRNLATLPPRLGGLGLKSAERTSTAAYWAGWVDALGVLKDKRPGLARQLLEELDKPTEAQPPCLREASTARSLLIARGYRAPPTWREAANGTVAPQPQNAEAGEFPHGWQFHAGSALERDYRNRVVLPSATPQRQALLRSQSGHAAGKWLSTVPQSPELVLTPLRMQVALRLRLNYTLPLGPRRCNGRTCRARLDAYGHHWTACNRSGRLRLRAKPLERTWARVFREAGARVQENVFLRNTNLPHIQADDNRSLEVVATGLPLYRGVPLAVDCTLTAPLHADGRPWRHADDTDGVAIQRGEREKLRKYPDLVRNSRLRLTTLASETGGRWSQTCVTVVRLLAKAKARQAPEEIQARVTAAWASRWWNLLSIACRNTLAATLVNDAPLLFDGVDGKTPAWTDVLRDEAGAPSTSNTGNVAGVNTLPTIGKAL